MTNPEIHEEFVIGGVHIAPGEFKRISITVAPLYDFTEMTIPVEVRRGRHDGPVLFVSAALHGDEINGVEIIQRLLRHSSIRKIKGTLIAVPIVNVFGFTSKSRYLPDRRDLNRSFPGSEKGSLAARLAHIFMQEIVSKCTHGIDLHTAAIHRTNFPQIRADLDNSVVNKMAHAFGVPVILNSAPPEGALRKAAEKKNIPVIVYEGGEALRFNDRMVKSGLLGILNVMRLLGMLPARKKVKKKSKTVFTARSSHWIRASHSGIVSMKRKMGARVKDGDLLAVISDPFGEHIAEVRASHSGIIVGGTVIPLVNEGDALFHIATFRDEKTVNQIVESFQTEEILSEREDMS